MNHNRIAIIGGGLSGLYAAYQLEQRGITDYVIIEARDSLGGRIMNFSVGSDAEKSQFDLGPSWFWPEFQPQLDSLIEQLGLEKFVQYEQGSIVVERSPNEAPISMRGYASSPTSMRLKGGIGTLIRALRSKLKSPRITLSSRVRSICNENGKITVSYHDNNEGADHQLSVGHVFVALPPRLAVQSIRFSPSLPSGLEQQWKNTATWMAAQAKYVAVYKTPFWRENGLSGGARSARGPMVEIHDASMPDGRAGIFGFLGIPASYRKQVGEEDMKAHCRAQLSRLFGDKAASPETDIIKDWAQDSLTATEADMSTSGEHSHAPDKIVQTGPWQHCLTGVGSEWSVRYPGYLAGAIEAVGEGIEHYLGVMKQGGVSHD